MMNNRFLSTSNLGLINKVSYSDDVPKVIWIYWDSIELPYFLKVCVHNIKSHCSDFNVNVLNEINVGDYIDLPELPKNIKPAIKADLIRLKLLHNFGGIWMDASTILTCDLSWLLNNMDGYEAFLFCSDECTIDWDRPVFENWFILAKKNSPFIKEWLLEFERCLTSPDAYSFYSEIISDKSFIQNINNPSYLLCYISALVVSSKAKYNILYLPSSKSGHYYNYLYKYQGRKIALDLLIKNKNMVHIPELIKFTSGVRKTLIKFIMYRFFRRKSLVGGMVYLYEKSRKTNGK